MPRLLRQHAEMTEKLRAKHLFARQKYEVLLQTPQQQPALEDLKAKSPMRSPSPTPGPNPSPTPNQNPQCPHQLFRHHRQERCPARRDASRSQHFLRVSRDSAIWVTLLDVAREMLSSALEVMRLIFSSCAATRCWVVCRCAGGLAR